MDALQSVSQVVRNADNISPAPSSQIRDCNKTAAIAAYKKVDKSDLSLNVQFDAKIVHAVRRWTAHSDVRVEFYTTKSLGEIRVKIIANGAGGKTCDMALSTFVSSSSATI